MNNLVKNPAAIKDLQDFVDLSESLDKKNLGSLAKNGSGSHKRKGSK